MRQYPREKTTLMIVFTSSGRPSTMKGAYRHRATASLEDNVSKGEGVFRTRISFGRPSFPIMVSKTTAPLTWDALAAGG
jgi:hypothetical protein